ncbi:aminotransferase class I/II-fold pyridoxal phosphate-dependent enzyme [Bifidobacterium sp. ESL0745]|uniref:aminotransferase class I/II-fold pyridoxal phosphate-dependent enzyme n=1 Tax=Bifidobacterium sp. ESL0745 TaxID=2983226 RepID=UPI0023F95583|nr:aminotransferase class I/II-fold pyridoxal phosphate-dependent enzyme [Bifidobacterium sp. ESL0745]MDF7665494.1 aminotransferase class I/II-fold pyridoxal phosphate-dependent enzyme [Bifidobacterium sp. ESL0745]
MGFYRFDSPYDWNRVAPYKETAKKAPGGMIDLSVGSPVDPVPASVQRALADAADAPNAYGYPTVVGMPALRDAIAGWFRTNRGVDFEAIDADFVPTVGSKEGVALMASLLHFGPGDVIVQPAVSYPTYEIGTQLAGAKAYKAADIADVDSWRCVPGVKAIWVNSPSNPTGEVLSASQLHGIVAAAREIGAVVLSDECYGLLTWADNNAADGVNVAADNGQPAKQPNDESFENVVSRGASSVSRSLQSNDGEKRNSSSDADSEPTSCVLQHGRGGVRDLSDGGEFSFASYALQSNDTNEKDSMSCFSAPAPCMLQPDVCDGSAKGILVLYSLSKQSNMAGYRTALIAGDPDLVRPMTVYRKQIGEIIPGPVQAAMAVALQDSDAVKTQQARYDKRLHQLVDGLRANGYDARMPQGALYVWVRAKSGDCWQDMADLARLGIVASPGEFYGDPTHLRFSSTATDASIAEVVARLRG